MIKSLLIIGIGGFFGSIGRYLFAHLIYRWFEPVFPISTLVVNVLGSLLIGIVYALSEKGGILSEEWKLFLTIGLLGGFTTFSTFTIEMILMLRDGQYFNVFMYAMISVFAGLADCFFGMFIIRSI
jgi:fluoride exporter